MVSAKAPSVNSIESLEASCCILAFTPSSSSKNIEASEPTAFAFIKILALPALVTFKAPPLTSSLAAGLVVPIPTFPLPFICITGPPALKIILSVE